MIKRKITLLDLMTFIVATAFYCACMSGAIHEEIEYAKNPNLFDKPLGAPPRDLIVTILGILNLLHLVLFGILMFKDIRELRVFAVVGLLPFTIIIFILFLSALIS